MSPKHDWLWDRKITVKKAKVILKDPQNKHFLLLSSLLLSRKNEPKEVFKVYINPVLFLQHWNKIRRQMRKDSWNNPRIEYWQAIYETIKEKYKKKGLHIPKKAATIAPQNEFCKLIAQKIKVMRKQKNITQSALAKKLKVSQQIISRIETGRENISLLTLKKIVDSLEANIYLEIS
jgi:DNA-binding XRE family transcriptional regulator